MKLNKQYIVVILIALIAMDNIATMNAISVERRREYRKQKSNVKWFWSGWFTSSTKNKVITKPIKPTKQKFFAFGKGLLIGLVLGVIYKLIGVGVEKAMGALFGPVDSAKPETDPQQPELLAKIDDIHKLVTGDTGGFTAGKWDEFPTTAVTSATDEILGGTEPEVEVPKTLPVVADDGTAPKATGPTDKVATAKKAVNSAKLDEKAAAAANTIIDSTKAESAVANDPLAKTAQSGTLTDKNKQDFAKIVLLAQAQMKNVKALAEKAATDVTEQKNSDKDIYPAAQSLWNIASDFGKNLKSQITTVDLWKGIAKNILIQIGVAAAIIGISILNPIAGAVAAAAWAAYKFVNDVYGLIKVIISCLREDGTDQNKNCGQNGIAAGMRVINIVASFLMRKAHKKHHHKNHRLAHKIRQSKKFE